MKAHGALGLRVPAADAEKVSCPGPLPTTTGARDNRSWSDYDGDEPVWGVARSYPRSRNKAGSIARRISLKLNSSQHMIFAAPLPSGLWWKIPKMRLTAGTGIG